MNPSDTLLNALNAGQSEVTLYGKFSEQQLHDIFNAAWERVEPGLYPEGVAWNASFDDKHVEFQIDYKGQRPKNSAPIPQKPHQNPPENQKPIPKQQQPESTPKPKNGGLRGLWERFMGGGNPNQNGPKPQPQHERQPKQKPIQQNGQHIPLEDLDRPLPEPDHVESLLCESDATTYVDKVNINYAASFMLDAMSDHRRHQAIIQKELPTYAVQSEGACSLSVSARTRGPCCTFFIDFDLGMKNNVFYDHLGKGRRAAKTTMYRLTHNGNFADIMKIYLAYAYFQKEVTYNMEYASKRNTAPDGNMHMAYGPLTLKSGVCEGYSWALIHMLASAGIPAALCFGRVQGRGDHAWVKVELNGRIYNVDPTIMPRSDGAISVIRFLKSDAYLKAQGYIENNPIYHADDDLYDDTYDVIEELNRYRDAAIRAGADRNILMSQTIGGK